MRVINALVLTVLLALPLAWMAIVSMSLYQAMTSLYTHADRTALHIAYGD